MPCFEFLRIQVLIRIILFGARHDKVTCNMGRYGTGFALQLNICDCFGFCAIETILCFFFVQHRHSSPTRDAAESARIECIFDVSLTCKMLHSTLGMYVCVLIYLNSAAVIAPHFLSTLGILFTMQSHCMSCGKWHVDDEECPSMPWRAFLFSGFARCFP